MVTIERLYSVEEFMRLPDDGRSYELVDGELVEMPQGPSFKHGAIVRNLFRSLDRFVTDHGLGTILSDTAFSLNLRTARRPDLGFISQTKLATITDEDIAVPFPPDIAVEVISPTDEWSMIGKKLLDYNAANVPLIWLIDPTTQIISVYRIATGLKPHGFDINDRLDGETIIPNYSIAIADIFKTK